MKVKDVEEGAVIAYRHPSGLLAWGIVLEVIGNWPWASYWCWWTDDVESCVLSEDILEGRAWTVT